jgi:4-amino-4-deoxy-L-arabinose transferase-like glycosyltransferase
MTFDDARARRLLVAAAAVGLVLRLVFALLYWVDRPLTHDEREYLALARSLASGGGFAYDATLETGTAQQFGRAPGYPLFLAALDAGRPVPSSTPVRVKIAQSLAGAAAVWLIGLIAMRSAGARAGVAAAFLAAFYPPLVFIPAYALSESVYCLAALATAFALQAALDRSTSRTEGGAAGFALLAGAVAGIAALVRPAMLFFLPLAFAWLIFRRRPVLALALAAAAALVILPWTLRNLGVHDRFVLIASEGGVTFWTGNHPLARGEGDLAANPDLKRAELELRRSHPGLTAEQLEPVYYGEAFRWIAAHPLRWAGLVARKAFYTIVPIGPSYAVHSLRYRVASVASYLMVLPFALVGARRLWRSRRPPVALFLLAGSSILMCLVFFPQERFRIPVIDPTLIVAAAAVAGRAES